MARGAKFRGGYRFGLAGRLRLRGICEQSRIATCLPETWKTMPPHHSVPQLRTPNPSLILRTSEQGTLLQQIVHAPCKPP